jgi:hypothetical protein
MDYLTKTFMVGCLFDNNLEDGKKDAKKVTMQASAQTFGATKGKFRPDKQTEPVQITDALSDVRIK